MHYLVLRYLCLLMFESNNVNVSKIKMTLDLKKYKLRPMFLPKKYAEKISEIHIRIHSKNIRRCNSKLNFNKIEFGAFEYESLKKLRSFLSFQRCHSHYKGGKRNCLTSNLGVLVIHELH